MAEKAANSLKGRRIGSDSDSDWNKKQLFFPPLPVGSGAVKSQVLIESSVLLIRNTSCQVKFISVGRNHYISLVNSMRRQVQISLETDIGSIEG